MYIFTHKKKKLKKMVLQILILMLLIIKRHLILFFPYSPNDYTKELLSKASCVFNPQNATL